MIQSNAFNTVHHCIIVVGIWFVSGAAVCQNLSNLICNLSAANLQAEERAGILPGESRQPDHAAFCQRLYIFCCCSLLFAHVLVTWTHCKHMVLMVTTICKLKLLQLNEYLSHKTLLCVKHACLISLMGVWDCDTRWGNGKNYFDIQQKNHTRQCSYW